MTRRSRARALEGRLAGVARLVDKIDRNVERIELVTLVREPDTSLSADAYDGLRKQVVAASGERSAHLHQLAQFDVALRAGATVEDLQALVAEWLGQASVEVVDDPTLERAFDFVGPPDGADERVANPAYVDALTGRVVKTGVVERTAGSEPAPEVAK